MSIPPSPDSQRLCPNCGNPLSHATILCPYCGVAVPEAPVWPPPPPRDLPGNNQQGALWLGIGAADLAGIGLVLLNQWLLSLGGSNSGIFLASDFTAVPLAMGILSAFFWRKERFTAIQYLGYSALSSVISLALAAALLHEGAICLLIASPLLIVIVWIGSMAGKWLFGRNDNRLNLSLAPLLLTFIVCDSLMPHHYANSETDTILIHAPPAQVWRYIVDYPPITEKPDYWLFRIGLPAPMQATSSGHFVGAARQCIFSRNAIFDERIVELEPNKKLTFDIVQQPKDPEIVGHLRINRGRFILHDNGDGTTTVTGTSWYHLNVYPVCYYDLWTQDIIRHVHLRAMRHIQALAEAPL